LHNIDSHFHFGGIENIDWGFVGLVNWFNGKEVFWGSPRVYGIKLFNDISNFPWADDQIF
jgi:hypothetical protein